MENLLTNAAKYTSQGMIIVSVTENEDYVIIAVKDSGRGIPPEQLEKIFEIGFTTDEKPDYHGIGLYNVKKAIEQHGGEIRAYSTEGIGSIFQLYLPK